jgi:YcaO-like protein with predicted kinase domain
MTIHQLESRARNLRKIPGTQRTVAPEETYDRVLEGSRALGVTRLADITGLDRIGIPTYSAIVPRSNDIISVYTGKGIARIDAKVGALMEAIERQTALRAHPQIVIGSLEELQRNHTVLDPTETKDNLLPDYSETRDYAWVFGREIISQRDILVPASMAGYFWPNLLPGPFVRFSSSNGLSSGNVREEAICQGLCELIERDASTLADIGARLLPWVFRRAIDPETADEGVDNFEAFQSLELNDDPAMELFRRAGLQPVLHDITSDIGVPTIYAAVADEAFPGFPMAHGGLGTHPDARVAVRRSLTEAAQSRCVDIQGVREDLVPASDGNGFHVHTRRIAKIDRRMWTLNESQARRNITDLPSAVHDDVQEDIDYLLSRLQSCGINQVIVVDFTPADAPFAVVRVIVPELETWSANHARLGNRALKYWQTHV